jgi:hypothetical protein
LFLQDANFFCHFVNKTIDINLLLKFEKNTQVKVPFFSAKQKLALIFFKRSQQANQKAIKINFINF